MSVLIPVTTIVHMADTTNWVRQSYLLNALAKVESSVPKHYITVCLPYSYLCIIQVDIRLLAQTRLVPQLGGRAMMPLTTSRTCTLRRSRVRSSMSEGPWARIFTTLPASMGSQVTLCSRPWFVSVDGWNVGKVEGCVMLCGAGNIKRYPMCLLPGEKN